MLRKLLFVVFLLSSVMAYHQVMIHTGSGSPPPMAPTVEQADLIVVNKTDRVLTLFRQGDVIKSYKISLGGQPKGHKTQEGDQRTPEGEYIIDWRNAHSIAHLSLHISYPNAEDIKQAKARGVSPGGNIMIHGLLNGWGWLGALHTQRDWTNGCVAISDAQMRELWSLVPNGTKIHLKP